MLLVFMFFIFFKPTMALSGLSGSQAAAERKKLFRTKSQVMAEEEEQRRQVPRGNRGSRVAVVFTPDLSYKNNVGETKINHWFGKGLYHLFMVIWGILYYCFTHIIQYNFYKYVYCMLWIDMNGYMIANMYRMCIYIYTHDWMNVQILWQLADSYNIYIHIPLFAGLTSVKQNKYWWLPGASSRSVFALPHKTCATWAVSWLKHRVFVSPVLPVAM